ncbi:MAG: DUF4149 domain-containing protein, partial [Candidatus Binataceae bacterium]
IALFFYLFSIVCWLGGMVFFTAMIAPVVFQVLPVADAGKVVAGIFPRYYLLGYAAGAVSVALAILFAVAYAPRLWWSLAALALLIALGLTLYAGVVVRPHIDSIRGVTEETNPDPARRAEFDHLHRLSVMLNGGVMLLDILALLSTAAALIPHA